MLESQGQALSADLKHSRQSSHPPAREPRMVTVSRLDTQQGTAATHRLKSKGQSLSAGLKHRKA